MKAFLLRFKVFWETLYYWKVGFHEFVKIP